MSQQTQHLFAELYAAFAAVDKPRKIDGCRCCIDDKEVHVLLTKSLREISAEEMASYAGSALLTVGSPDDYRYFLPRILEIKMSVPAWWPDWEVLGRKLREARWETWSALERQAILQVFDRQLQLALEGNDGAEIDGLLCGLACAELDLAPHLSRVGADPARVLALYTWHANELEAGALANGFWSDAPQGATQLLAWFRSEKIGLIVLDACGVDLSLPPNSSP